MRRADVHLLPESGTKVPSDLDILRRRYQEPTRSFRAAATAGDVVVLMPT